MLGGGINSRLFRRIRQKEGLSYGVGSQFNASSLDKSGSFMGFAIYAPQNVRKLETAFKEELEGTLRGFTAEELATAKSGYLQAQQVSRAQDQELGRKLSSYLFIDRTLAWDRGLEKKIEPLTSEQIVEALKRHLDLSKISLIKAGDFAKASSNVSAK
jgi:zinc protease